MIQAFVFLLLTLPFYNNVGAQKASTECPYKQTAKFDVFIRGYSDTIQKNGLKARVIDVASVINGFELSTNDSLAKVLTFQMVFDDTITGELYSRLSKGNKMPDDERHIVPLTRIKNATLITIERIRIEYKGVCYTLPGQVYYPK